MVLKVGRVIALGSSKGPFGENTYFYFIKPICGAQIWNAQSPISWLNRQIHVPTFLTKGIAVETTLYCTCCWRVPLSKKHPRASSVYIHFNSILQCRLGVVCSEMYRWEQRRWQETPGEERESRRGWCRGSKETNTVPKRVWTDETKMRSGSRTWSDNTEKH